jgi:tryptophan-rich sensory protein
MTAIASKAQLRMSFLRWALVTVPAILLLGTLSGRIAGSGYDNPWFAVLAKPAIMPEASVFPLAWTILYVLLGVALAMILHARGAKGRGLALGLFFAQLLLNFAWSPIFFGLHQVTTALLVLLLMLALAAATTFLFAGIRKAAALLMLPYLAWLAFAALLNFQIMQLNPGAESLVPGEAATDIAF